MRLFKKALYILVLTVFAVAVLAIPQTDRPFSETAALAKTAAPEKIVIGVEHKIIKKKLHVAKKTTHAKVLLSVRKRAVKKTKKKNVQAAVVQPVAAPNPTAQFNGSVEQQIVDQVNSVRSQNGLCTLQVRSNLTNFARQWSLQQYDNGSMSHGMLNFPRNSIAGQNVAYAEGDVSYFGWDQIWSAQATMTSWMQSPGHRANILNRNYRYIGVGVVYGERNGGTDGWVFFTQDFAN
ncbi:MAG: CAP domain-containing protein [Sporolactobacillus sp.]